MKDLLLHRAGIQKVHTDTLLKLFVRNRNDAMYAEEVDNLK